MSLRNPVRVRYRFCPLCCCASQAYTTIRKSLSESHIYVGDAFNSRNFNNFWTNDAATSDRYTQDVQNVLLDTHMYQCFTPEGRGMSASRHVYQVCLPEHTWLDRCCWGQNYSSQQRPEEDHGTPLGRIVGEWTLAYDQVQSCFLSPAVSTLA